MIQIGLPKLRVNLRDMVDLGLTLVQKPSRPAISSSVFGLEEVVSEEGLVERRVLRSLYAGTRMAKTCPLSGRSCFLSLPTFRSVNLCAVDKGAGYFCPAVSWPLLGQFIISARPKSSFTMMMMAGQVCRRPTFEMCVS